MTSRSRLDDFAQHDGSVRAGDAGEVSWQAVQGAVREDSEGDGFFGVHRQAVTVGEFNRQMRQQFDQALHEQPIVRAAARDNQAVNLLPRKNKASQRAGDGPCGQLEGGSKQVLEAGAAPPLAPLPNWGGDEGWGGK